jgi:flagellar biosynthesis/type III secretory pathway chaperone
MAPASAPASAAEAARALVAQLPALIAQLQSLQQALQTERAALTASDAAALQASTEAKAQLLDTLEAHNQQLYALLPALGLSADAQGLAQWLQGAAPGAAPLPPAVQSLQQQLRTALEACRDTNLGNGLLVGAAARDTQVLLGILSGGATDTEAVTYDARGVQSSNRAGPNTYRSA